VKSRWKLHLRPKHLTSSINRDNYLPPLPSGKSADDVLTDFIKYLFECIKTYIHELHLAFPWSSVENSIEFIVTHPNGWEGEQQRYRRAIVRAGLVPDTREGQSRVRMLTDGEAILHFCIANLVNVETTVQATPRGVVIIDAGGGTINLNMFSMKFNPTSCEEIALAECMQLSSTVEFLLIHLYPFLGPLQGSVFVTRRANALLQSWWLTLSIALPVTSLRNSKRRKTRRLEALQPRGDYQIYRPLRPDNKTRHQE